MTELRADIAAAWVRRLRDPASKQAYGTLFDGEGRCCLGHLACVLRDEFPAALQDTRYAEDPQQVIARGRWFGYPTQLDYLMGSVPPQVLAHIGMTDLEESCAGDKNDKFDQTLPEIADWIEAGMPLGEESSK